MDGRARRAGAALVVLTMTGCGAPTDDEARASWLQSTLTDDNRDLLWRAPELVAGKYVKMSQDPYAFLRGTVLQWVRDLAQPSGLDLRTRFGNADASRVLLDGDPHPENFGSFLPADGEITVELNDFDAARYGPYWADLWRLAQGFEVIARRAPTAWNDTTVATVVRAVALGYHTELVELEAGQAPLRVAYRAGHGAIVDDLMRQALRDGGIQEELLEYTRVQDGARRLFRGEIEPMPAPGLIGEVVVDVDTDTRDLVERFVAEYAGTLVSTATTSAGALAVKDVARQIGSGVSSFALYRYYVLVEGPTEGLDDDWLLEAKEIRDPASFPGLAIFPSRRYTSNAERVVRAQRSLQLVDDADPLLGFASSGGFSLRVRHRTKNQKRIDHARLWEELEAGDIDVEDVRALAELCGRLLARSHGKAPLSNGAPALPALRAAVGDDPAAFADEVEGVSGLYTARILADYDLFLALLEVEGPLLGFRTSLP